MPTLLHDITDPDVGALVPQWLTLVAERITHPGDGRQVRVLDRALNIIWPGDLLLAVVHDADSTWKVRAMLLREVSVGGRVAGKFTSLGTLDAQADAGCGSVQQMVGYLEALSERDLLAEELLRQQEAPAALIAAWASSVVS